MDLTKRKFSVESPFIGLLIAASLPIVGLAFTSPEAFFIAALVAVPFSLACMLVIGTPTYFLLKKYNLLSFPSCILGGILCSIPGSIIFSPSGLPVEFSIGNYIVFSLLGASGGFVFWGIHARLFSRDQSRIGSIVSLALLLVLGMLLVYLNQFKNIDYIEGETPTNDTLFVAQHERKVPVLVQDEPVFARLGPSVPYRKNCKVSLSKWRNLFSHEIQYSISHYPDQPRAHHYRVLSDEVRAKVSKTCTGDAQVVIY